MVGEDRQDGKLNTLENLIIPKNRSSGSLAAMGKQAASTNRIRFSIDSEKSDADTFIKSPVLSEHEHGMGISGLRRIRRQPPSRAPTLPPSPELSFTLPSRSSSISLNLNRQSTFPSSGPQSPALTTFGEDLTRFPSESLHSYSFAHQSEEVLHDRQEIIRRSIDLVGEKLGWANHDPRILNAQAKVNGDAEMQSIVELLSRANVLGGDSDRHRDLGLLGPLTGPPHLLGGENVFEKGFETVQSPISDEDASPGLSIPATLNTDSRTTSSQSKLSSVPCKDTTSAMKGEISEQPSVGMSLDDSSIPSPKTIPSPRPGGLKRSTTDIGPLYLRSKLETALAKPYLAEDSGHSTSLLAPPILPTLGKQAAAGISSSNDAGSAGFVKHRWTPAAQCLFTSEAQPPYTMQSANDLACLVFGVRKDQIRKISMMEVIRIDRREWLSERLSSPAPGAAAKSKAVPLKPARKSPSPSTSLAMRGGITAMLLSKPPSRFSNKAIHRAQTDDGSGSSLSSTRKTSLHHQANKSRGVLLCGDVVPIQKQNGHMGAATLWVKEKKGGLIWVLEEIVEDVAQLTLDTAGKVLSATGAVEVLFGDKPIDRKDIRSLIPRAPLIGTPRRIDYETMKKVQYYTVKNSNDYILPASLSVMPSLGEVHISTFPHIAGIMVLSSETLDITSSNSVFSAALFGHKKPDGLHITELIPQFRKLLDFLTDEESINLVDGIVIPEHSFRRARAMLAIREGSKDPSALFLRSIGLTAKHRDGTTLNIDVQMRVVRSESVDSANNAIQEAEEDEDGFLVEKPSKPVIVYALWITYSRNLHSLAPSGLPPSPLLSRPSTPPRQPSPGQSVTVIQPELMNVDSPQPMMTPGTLIAEQLKEAFLEPISHKMTAAAISITQDSVDSEPEEPPHKKTIADFQILEDMGQGAYGQVKLARYKKPAGEKVVLKYVTKKRILVDTWTRDRKLGTVPLEIHVLHYLRKDGLRHSNIVEMLDFFEDNTNYYIEMVPHGLPGMDLFDYIEMRATMEEAECRNIFRQVVSALHHLHTKALVVHRDIKDENIVLDGNNNVKLIDFGSAAYIKSGPFDVFVGTIDYAAPEVLQGRSYRGKEQDVWALGILLYTIIYKENPFYSVDEILDRELRVPWVMSNGSIELVRGMLNRDVDQRMSIEDVAKHPWTKGEEGWQVFDEL